MKTIDAFLTPDNLQITRENAERSRKKIPLNEAQLQGELSELRTLFSKTTNKERLVLISQHIASLESMIQYRKNHPLSHPQTK